MPHRTQMQVIKRRLTGKEGSERVRELRSILAGLPDYKNGPFADIRKWVNEEIEASRLRNRVVNRDSIAVRREGAAQVALVGAPNAGKSSLLHALSHIQIAIGNYAFTTLRPVPALTRIGGVLVQLVEIPGLIEGANEDRGGGRALLGVLRGADAIVYCHDVSQPVDSLLQVMAEVSAAGIEMPTLLAATKTDEAPPGAVERLAAAVAGIPIIGVSVLDDAGLECLKEAIWRLTGLVRVYSRLNGDVQEEPFALEPGATVADLAGAIHNQLGTACKGARLWGPGAKFPGQEVGRDHALVDGDIVEILAAR
jgi:small GTP-binding protein